MNVIYLDQPTAKTMTDMKEFVEVYQKHNKDGKFDENILRYKTVYKTLMNEVLGR